MFTLRIHEVPTAHTVPYNVQCATLLDAIRYTTDNNIHCVIVSITDQDDAVHFGVIRKSDGSVLTRHSGMAHVGDSPNSPHDLYYHRSKAYLEAQETPRPKAKLA